MVKECPSADLLYPATLADRDDAAHFTGSGDGSRY
jgi:hypothetical protein